MKKLIFNALIILVFVPEVVLATTYYVKTTGNDGSFGLDTATAWATIDAAFARMNPGDTTLVLEGIYYPDYNLGPASDSVTLKACPGHEVWAAGFQQTSSSQRSVFYIEGRSGVVFDSINVKYGAGSGVEFQYCDRCKFLNAKICSTYAGWNSPPRSANMLEFTNCDTCEIMNCELYVTGIGGDTTYQRSHNNVGIIFYGKEKDDHGWGHVVRKNKVHSVVCGIWYKQGGTGAFWCDSNIVYDYKSRGIFITTDSARVHHNLIYAGDCPGVYGIYLGAYAGETHAENDARFGQYWNNTIFGTAGPGICVHRSIEGVGTIDSLEFWNNIVVNASGSEKEMVVWIDSQSEPDSFYSDYNCIYDSDDSKVIRWTSSEEYTLSEFQSAKGLDLNSMCRDPLFVDPEAGDFRLQSGSPCRNGGRDGEVIGAFTYEGYQPGARSDIDQGIGEHKDGRMTDSEVEELIESYYRGQ